MFVSILLVIGLAAANQSFLDFDEVSGKAKCPAYTDIAQPSVNKDHFSIEEFDGTWYMVATNEPTLPSFCVCGVNENTIDTAGGHYYYTNKDSCHGVPFSLDIKGDLSKDPEWPGDLRENAAVMNHTVGSLDP